MLKLSVNDTNRANRVARHEAVRTEPFLYLFVIFAIASSKLQDPQNIAYIAKISNLPLFVTHSSRSGAFVFDSLGVIRQ